MFANLGAEGNHGIRFVPIGKHDYLYWVWDCYNNLYTSKVYIMTKVERLAIQQGILPALVTFNLMGSRASGHDLLSMALKGSRVQ